MYTLFQTLVSALIWLQRLDFCSFKAEKKALNRHLCRPHSLKQPGNLPYCDGVGGYWLFYLLSSFQFALMVLRLLSLFFSLADPAELWDQTDTGLLKGRYCLDLKTENQALTFEFDQDNFYILIVVFFRILNA